MPGGCLLLIECYAAAQKPRCRDVRNLISKTTWEPGLRGIQEQKSGSERWSALGNLCARQGLHATQSSLRKKLIFINTIQMIHPNLWKRCAGEERAPSLLHDSLCSWMQPITMYQQIMLYVRREEDAAGEVQETSEIMACTGAASLERRMRVYQR
ncbi:hypothetical protein Y1Q_0010978 [Alligator mississippiensis]|uniref:Uncharacterized protein n=1 Tax=Alligator mississippiensis TaxID=8496 RepID=A0A151NL92_ALLMI|nr:hypothetical protein Y1Q_0010978 [Alligator mississippiensis]